jgi:hypothetical protein
MINSEPLHWLQVSMIPGSITSSEFETQLEKFKGSTVVCYW